MVGMGEAEVMQFNIHFFSKTRVCLLYKGLFFLFYVQHLGALVLLGIYGHNI